MFQSDDGVSIPTSALDLIVRLTNHETAMLAYRQWHYLKDTPFIAIRHYGVFFDGCCVGCISYGPPTAKEMLGLYTRHTQNGVVEIKRLALSDICPKNSESRVIAISLRLLRRIEHVRLVITLADTSRGHNGGIYKASGFEYLGLSAKKTDFYLDGKKNPHGPMSGRGAVWEPRPQKHVFVKRFGNS